MLNNETRRELLNRARAVQFPGSIMEVYRASEQGIDLLADHEAQMQQEMQVAQTQQQQETGLREEHARGNTQASMAFPNVQPNQSFNTEGMAAPINVDKYSNQGHLVESYKNVPPGIKNLPTGPYEGTVIETPAEYQEGGVKKQKKSDVRKRKYIKKYQNGGFEQQYKKGGAKSWLNWANPLYLAERVKNQIPLNVRQLTADLVGSEDSINLNDLNYREKAALEEARKRAEARGSSRIEYQDYGTHLDDEGNAYQDPYADVGGGAGTQALTKSLNPSYSLKTTFGQMGFKKNKDGTYTYTDQYNFNNATGGGVKGWWEGAKTKGLDLYGQVRNVATNFGSENKKGAEVKINMRKGGYRAKYPKGGLKLNSPLLKRNDFSLATRNLEHNAFTPGDGSTGYSLVNRLEGMGDDLSKNFNLATNPTFLNTKKLNLKGSFNADPGVGWDGSNKGLSSFGSPTLNPTGAASFDLAYRPTKKTTLNAGVDYKTGSSPYYRAGLNIKLKRGGYRKKYL
tara:strand:+ start:288 stop:1820 length:1533 start_codon:yes stop_codon:yes gene_type:complete